MHNISTIPRQRVKKQKQLSLQLKPKPILMSSSASSVKVAVRLRPMNKAEETQGTLPVVNASSVDNTITAIKANGRGQQRSSFSFDNVFSSYTTQEQVFEATLKPVIVDVLQGFESTVFAYGQTGTGKTHTMEGDLSDPDSYGVIPRAAESIFDVLNRPEYISHSVVVSYLEIYNEELCDLLSGDEYGHRSPKKICRLEIMESKDGVICRGLTEREVRSASDVLEVMKRAQQFRKIGETKMNKQSSRSHCVFTLRLTAKKMLNDGNVFDTRGKLHLVDLAGSECAKSASLDSPGRTPMKISSSRSMEGRDEVSRERGRERSNINRSLLTLGRVIIMLKEQSQSRKSSHMRIPYRDSKLTRILQDSLGGRCKTQIIATVSPSVLSIEETMSTLNYAQSASGIVNKPVAVSYLSVGANGSRGTTATSEMSELKSVEHWQEMEMRMEYMQSQVEEAQAALARQYREQKGIIDRAEKAEEDLMYTEQKLKISEHNLEKSNRILEATKETERRLTSEATDLMKKLDISIADGNELHNLLVQSREADFKRKEATKNFHAAVLEKVSLVVSKLGNLEKEGQKYHSSTVDEAVKRQSQEHEELNQSVQLLHEIQLHVSDLTMTMKSHVQDENGMMDVLAKMSDDVQEGILQAKERINSGEEALEACIDNARRDLVMHSNKLLEMERKYNTSSEDYVKVMEALISQSNDKVKNMVSSAVGALIQAREDSSKTRESLSETLATFHTVSAKSVARIQEESMKCSKGLTKSLDSFVDGMKHIDDIQEQLQKQRKTIRIEGGAHLKEIKEQKNLVISQQNALNSAKSEQKKLEQEFVQKVIKGVTNLVNEQMHLMSSKHEERLVALEKRNDSLSTLTEGVQLSANNIFSDIDSASESIRKHAHETRLNDEAIRTTAERTDAVLSNIEQISSNQKEVETEFYHQTNKNTSKLAEHELAITSASSNLQTDSSDVAVFITENLHDDMTSGVSTLSDLASNQAVYSRDSVVRSTDNQLESMAKPRAEVISNFSRASDSVLRSVRGGREKIEVAASKQCDAADELRSDVESKFNNFANDAAKMRRSSIDSRKKHVVESSDGFNKMSKDRLSSAVRYASTTREDVNNYATNTIKFQEEVPPITQRKRIQYNRKLSSTPADTILVKDIVLSPDNE